MSDQPHFAKQVRLFHVNFLQNDMTMDDDQTVNGQQTVVPPEANR
ncbi:MAG TPA: hypothetical protein VGV09_04025 [Steroidobacteraceae bacterium]|nr:hypothetical protein [Steroidobacteraceae bacterium]